MNGDQSWIVAPEEPRRQRAVILHVDDLGMCPGANRAFLELAAAGQVTCGSVMVPCAAFRQIAEAATADFTLDLGVHLTLTSEWERLRWAPLSTRSKASGLIDDDGCFWRDVRALAAHLVVEAAEEELRAQVEHAFEAGIRPTHIDAHMGAAMLPDLLGIHLQLAQDYGLFPVLPRRITFAPDPAQYNQIIERLDEQRLPIIDGIRGTLPVAKEELESGYRRVFQELGPGVTHFALHCTAPDEIEGIPPDHAYWRTNEYQLFSTGAVDRWCDLAGILRVGLRQFQTVWRTSPCLQFGAVLHSDVQ